MIASPLTSAVISAPGAPFPGWLPEHALEGVFPPEWRSGMEWRISVATDLPADGAYRLSPTLVTRTYQFRVVSVPGEQEPYFTLEMRPARMLHANPTILKFRASDRSFSSDGPSTSHQNREQPFIETSEVQGQLAFPALPVEKRNPYLFISRTDGTQQPGKQRFDVRPDGVTITIEIDETPFNHVREAVVEWKRGDPWPASVSLWYIDREDRGDSGDGPPERSFVASSKLIRAS